MTGVSNANANRDTLSLRRSLPYQETTTCHHSLVVFRAEREDRNERKSWAPFAQKNCGTFVATTLSTFTLRSRIDLMLHYTGTIILHHVVPSALLHVRCSAVNICISGPFFLLPSLRRKRHCHCCILRRVDNLARIARSPSRFSSPHPHPPRQSIILLVVTIYYMIR